MDVEAQQHPLSDIFPGETMPLASGKTITIRMWGAREVVQDIPAIIARIAVRAAQSGKTDIMELVPVLLINSMGDILDLLKRTAGITEEDLDRMSGAELINVARAVLRVNRSFFDAIQGLYQDVGVRDLAGTVSLPPS